MDKFQSLLNEKALYLCRADRLQDRFEGSYSRHQILESEDWLTKIDHSQVIETERERRQNTRLKMYISCWCMSDCDLDLMWKAYVHNPPGIAIKSTTRRLKNICDKAVNRRPLDISKVTYFDHAGGEFIDEFELSPFLHKDNHFRLDNELRIIYSPNHSKPTPDHVFLPIDLMDLIEEVVLKPGTKESISKSVKEALNKAGLDKIPVFASRDDRELIE